MVRRRVWLPLAMAVGIAASSVVISSGSLLNRLFHGGFGAPQPIRLGVLPFENLTGDRSQDYFSDGLTEEMITELGRVQTARLATVGRTSTMRYKNTSMPTHQIGRSARIEQHQQRPAALRAV